MVLTIIQAITDKMLVYDWTVSCIDGDILPKERELVTTRVLLSTDLLSRGIDVNYISLVVRNIYSSHWSKW